MTHLERSRAVMRERLLELLTQRFDKQAELAKIEDEIKTLRSVYTGTDIANKALALDAKDAVVDKQTKPN